MKSLRRIVAIALGLLLLAMSPATTATAHKKGSVDGAVVEDWNAIAVRTIFVENPTPIPLGQLYFGFASSAVYDAVRKAGRVNGRHRRDRASVAAAVAAAAYGVLVEYLPLSAAALADDLEDTLADVPDGRREDRGVAIGEAAAEEIIEERVGDGRNAAITLDVTPGPGVWRPTPPANLPMALPWFGFVEPLLLDSPTQIELDGPPDLDSRQYAREFIEEKAVGEFDSTVRTAAQTATAHFWNANATLQFQDAMRDLSDREDMSAREAAKMYAAINLTTADALIACWRAKYDFAFWRPITAIHEAESDDNPRTTADPDWTPLIPTPPYPDYPSGHACLTGSVATGLADLAGSDDIDLYVKSVHNGVETTRHFTSAKKMIREAFNARIWLGIHFRTAMEDGSRIGKKSSRIGFEELDIG